MTAEASPRAVHALVDAGTMPANTVVPVFVMNDIATASETGLAENFKRAAMNPADECVAFRHFIEVEKSTPEDVARRFGLTKRFVEGRIRLASLADDVFEALRSGSITLDAAQAFATTDLARQSRVYAQVKNSWNGIDAGAVRRLMISETMVASDDQQGSRHRRADRRDNRLSPVRGYRARDAR